MPAPGLSSMITGWPGIHTMRSAPVPGVNGTMKLIGRAGKSAAAAGAADVAKAATSRARAPKTARLARFIDRPPSGALAPSAEAQRAACPSATGGLWRKTTLRRHEHENGA
jgi:hypothetical protein